jgi:hypothetical protein
MYIVFYDPHNGDGYAKMVDELRLPELKEMQEFVNEECTVLIVNEVEALKEHNFNPGYFRIEDHSDDAKYNDYNHEFCTRMECQKCYLEVE